MCRLAIAGAALLSALTLAACSSGGTGATGAIPTTEPPLATTSVPAVTSTPATTGAATTDPPSPAASPTPTAGDAAIFAGLQAYSDGFVAAIRQRDIAPLRRELDPECGESCYQPLEGAIMKAVAMMEVADFTQTITPGAIDKRSSSRACLPASTSNAPYLLRSTKTGAVVGHGRASSKTLEYCLKRSTPTGRWVVYHIANVGG